MSKSNYLIIKERCIFSSLSRTPTKTGKSCWGQRMAGLSTWYKCICAEQDLTFRASIDAANCEAFFPFPLVISSDPISPITMLDGFWRVQLEGRFTSTYSSLIQDKAACMSERERQFSSNRLFRVTRAIGGASDKIYPQSNAVTPHAIVHVCWSQLR